MSKFGREMGHISTTWEGGGALLYGCVLIGITHISHAHCGYTSLGWQTATITLEIN